MGEGKKDSGIIDRFADSVERFLKLEGPSTFTTLYKYPKDADHPTLWLEIEKKEEGFLHKPWYFFRNGHEGDIVTIPASSSRNRIHFFPPEAQEALMRDTEEEPWLENEDFRGKNLSIMRNSVTAFVDFLTFIRNGGLSETDYITGGTNSVMANIALALGFKRCWEEGFVPINPDTPLNDSYDHRVGVSVSELIDLYDLKKTVPTEQGVKRVLRRNIRVRRVKNNA